MCFRFCLVAVLAMKVTNALSNCTICPDGGPISKDIYIPLLGQSCGQLEVKALDANATECPNYQANAVWCNCSNVEPSCTLCPDGSSPPNATLLIPALNVTCGGLEYLATMFENQTTCKDISGFASECDCPGVEPTCSICNGGQPIKDPSFILPNGLSCDDVEAIANGTSSIGVLSDSQCSILRTYSAASCGCDPVEQNVTSCTSLCQDGSVMQHPYTVIGSSDSTEFSCGDLEKQLSQGPASGVRCPGYFYIGEHVCGCPATAETAPSCTLCEDGSIPPDLLLGLDRGTCADYAVALANTQDAAECSAVQATAGVTCGCDNPIAIQSACRICTSKPLPYPTRIADTIDGITCSEVEYVATMSTTKGCAGLRSQYEPVCCHEVVGLSPTVAPALYRPARTRPPGIPFNPNLVNGIESESLSSHAPSAHYSASHIPYFLAMVFMVIV